MKFTNNDNLFQHMESIVNSTMTSYKSDFEIDQDIIANSDSTIFAWLVREHGTHIKGLNNCIYPLEYVYSILSGTRVEQMYLIRFNRDDIEFSVATPGDYERIVEDMASYNIRFCDKNGHTINEFSGVFDNKKDCIKWLKKQAANHDRDIVYFSANHDNKSISGVCRKKDNAFEYELF